MLDSLKLFKKSVREIRQKCSGPYKSIIGQLARDLYIKIAVFIDIDLATNDEGVLRNEVLEIGQLFLKTDNKMYAVTSKNIKDSLFSSWGSFTSIHFHQLPGDSYKAETIKSIIASNNEGNEYDYKYIIFAGPTLIACLEPLFNELALVVDISDDDEVPQVIKKRKANSPNDPLVLLNIPKPNYSIMEYILYYMTICITTRKYMSP